MSGEREQALKDILEKIAADLKALSLTADTMCMGMERERMEPQATASLKTISMSLDHIRQNINNALKTEQENSPYCILSFDNLSGKS